MTQKTLGIALLLGAVQILAASPGRSDNLIQDWSFEGPVRESSYTFLHTGDDLDGVWFVTHHVSDVGHVHHYSGFPDPYPDGDQMMYIGDSGDAGTIVQPISTLLHAGTYTLNFWQGVLNLNQIGEARFQLAPITG